MGRAQHRLSQENTGSADEPGVSEKPALDYELCLSAERYATGEQIHTAANLLAVYLGEHSLAVTDFRPDRFYDAESRLRTFVRDLIFRTRLAALPSEAIELTLA